MTASSSAESGTNPAASSGSRSRRRCPRATYEVVARQFAEDVASVGIGAVGGLGDQRRAAHALGKRDDLANSVIAVQRRGPVYLRSR